MKKNICICSFCQKEFERPLKEIIRNQKLNRSIYCSRKCSGLGNKEQSIKNFGSQMGNYESLKGISKKDEFSCFRVFLRSAKKREKEVNINLEYLKQIWEEQNGICPLTGWKLSLERENKPEQASLGRIDSNKGYVRGNVRFTSLIANYCKSVFTDEQVIQFCKSVVSTYKS